MPLRWQKTFCTTKKTRTAAGIADHKVTMETDVIDSDVLLLLSRVSVVWRSEPVYLCELCRAHIMQSLI